MEWAANVLGLLLLVSPYPRNCGPIGLLNLEVEVTGNNIGMSWTVNTTIDNIYGFKAVLYNDQQQTLYTSSVIQSQERKTTISYELKGTCSVCIQGLLNNTEVLQEACKKVKVNNLKMVIGIMAGAIFLIPCLMVLAYIIYKDKKIAKLDDYAELESHSEQSVNTEPPSESKKTGPKDPKSATGNVDFGNRGETNDVDAANRGETIPQEPKSSTGNVVVANRRETRQEDTSNKKNRKESDTSERTDTKEPNIFIRKVVFVVDKAIQSGQAENLQLSSESDSNMSSGSKRLSSSKTNVTNAESISQKKTEIYIVRL